MDAIPKDWWAIPRNDFTTSLGWSQKGLTEQEAHHRLKIFGKNVLAKRRRFTIIERFFQKLTNPLIILLLFAAAISAFLKQTPDVIIIVVITVVSITIDVFQEHVAVEGAEKLRKRVSLTATVIRDGKQGEIPMSHVAPGDLVFLSVGDIVPADGRIISEKDILVDQSALTGESYPQRKVVDAAVPADAQVVDRKNSVFMGTNIVGGEAYMVVVSTGVQAELGKIAKELVERRPQTEFELGIGKFGRLLLQTAVVVSAVVFSSHLLIQHELFTTLLFVLALAIGFAPELLPVVITINLSKGAIRMSKRGVIVKNLQAIENFGSMDTLCTDKTGTLTENKITLQNYENFDGKRDVHVLDFGYLSSLFQIGFRGPMEHAILAHVKKADTAGYTRVTTIPFDFFRKRVSVIVRHNNDLICITKGAPEAVFSLCTRYERDGKIYPFTNEAQDKAYERFTALSRDGIRSLAVAYKQLSTQPEYVISDEKDLIFLGFLTFFDPPKKTVSGALKLLEHQGIAIKILTGDNDLVSRKVCEEIGLPVSGVVTSKDVENLSDSELSRVVEKTTIFARLNPDLKVRIMTMLKKNGHVVGFLGDGINDSTSLRASDIGISVENATDVARETADIILLQKDLHVLSEGVSFGRQTFWNVMKYMMMGTSSNFGNMLSVSLASVFLPFLPMLPTQILLNDLLYDVSQLFVANDRVDGQFIKKPRRWDIQFIKRFMLLFGPISSLFDVTIFAILLFVFKANAPLFQTGWFVESLVTQTLIVFSIRTMLVPFWQSHPSLPFAFGLIGVAFVALLIPLSPLGALFSFVPLPAAFYGLMIFIVGMYVFLVELLKSWFYRRYFPA